MDTLAFLLLLAAGAFVQTITGFAMGLIVMGGVALLGIIELTTAAAVVSMVSLVNVVVALRRHYRHIHKRLVAAILAGMAPMIFVGVQLLDFLSQENLMLLKFLLGLVIVVAGILLVSKPTPYAQVTGTLPAIATGMGAGLMGGMYGAGGAPTAYLMYRQPLLIQVVRATLLSTFAISTVIRTGFIAVEGHLTNQVGILFAYSVPVVIVMTLIGDKIAPLVPETGVRRAALWLLVGIGGTLMVSGAVELFT